MICKKCNFNNEKQAKFCRNCGGKLIEQNLSKKKYLLVFGGILVVVMAVVTIFMFSKKINIEETRQSKTEEEIAEKKLTFTANGVNFEMILVEGGTFILDDEYEYYRVCNNNNNEKPTHNVTLTDYYIGKFEVTQKLWKAVMETNIQQQCEKAKKNRLFGEGDDYPMYYIKYGECDEFCGKLNKLLSYQLPDGYKFRLPTEAQWEYAARGGKKSMGYTYSGSNDINDVAWSHENGILRACEVGLKDKNELGIYDMSGNILEWCYDYYDENYYNIGSDTNPKGPRNGSYRVWRGGSWNNGEQYCRISARSGFSPDTRMGFLGFRLSITP